MTYRLIDSGHFRKLEQVDTNFIIRPAPQAVWAPDNPDEWDKADVEFIRTAGGEGTWENRGRDLPETWQISYSGLDLVLKKTDFGHLGIFPEQVQNWKAIRSIITSYEGEKPFRLLNLFGYTGATTLTAASAGAEVVHLDASKTSVGWARENAALSGLTEKPIRWVVDDVRKFMARQVRRGSTYHGIALDPPSFGRGLKGEVWKIDEHIAALVTDLRHLLADDFTFVQLSSHSPGYSPLVLQNLLNTICADFRGEYLSQEMTVMAATGRALPCGANCIFTRS